MYIFLKEYIFELFLNILLPISIRNSKGYYKCSGVIQVCFHFALTVKSGKKK